VTSLGWIAFLSVLLTAILYNGRRPQMSCLRGHLHSPSTCSTTHAIPFVSSVDAPLAAAHSPFFSDTGDRPYKCQYCGDQFARRSAVWYHIAPILLTLCFLVTFYRDTSTNVTQTKNHYLLPVFVKKGRSRLLVPLPQNKSAISVFRQILLVMVVIHVVSFLFTSQRLSIFNNLFKKKKKFSEMRST
jgi:hypothetical protein